MSKTASKLIIQKLRKMNLFMNHDFFHFFFSNPNSIEWGTKLWTCSMIHRFILIGRSVSIWRASDLLTCNSNNYVNNSHIDRQHYLATTPSWQFINQSDALETQWHEHAEVPTFRYWSMMSKVAILKTRISSSKISLFAWSKRKSLGG